MVLDIGMITTTMSKSSSNVLGQRVLSISSAAACRMVVVLLLLQLLSTDQIQIVTAQNTAQLGIAWSTVQGKGQQAVTALISASNSYRLEVQELPGALPGRPKCYATVNFQNSAPPLQIWVANYLSNGIYSAAGICSLKLGQDGNLVLSQSGTAIWSSQTANKGVQSIQLQESGNLVLLTSGKKVVWQSFDNPSDTLVSGQRLALGTILFAADPNWPYSSAGIYSARVQEYSNDFSLFVDFDHLGYDGPIPAFNESAGSDRYWTLETVFAEIANAWEPNQARYVEVDNGITVFGAPAGTLVIHAPSNDLNPNKTFPEYARLEPDGNLKTFVLLPGSSPSWVLNFQALFSLCEFPNACGPYGICSGVFGPNQKCTGCPPKFQPINPSDLSQGCKPLKPLSTGGNSLCGPSIQLVELDGTGYSLLQSFYFFGELIPTYPSTLVSSKAQCQAACLADCACTAAFFYNLTFVGLDCFRLHTSVHTLQQIFNSPPAYHSAFIKVKY